MPDATKRRQFLGLVGAAGVAGLAGCAGSGGNGGGSGGDGGDGGSGGGSGNDGSGSGSSDYPSKAIQGVIPWGAGGGTDTIIREYAPLYEEELGVSIELENRTGASSRQGMNYLSQQDPDGYTIGFNDPSINVLGETLFETQYKTSELTAIGTTAQSPCAIFAPPGEYDDLDGLLNAVSQGDFVFGSSGVGTTNDFFGQITMTNLGADPANFRTAPMGSGSEAAKAPASGDVGASFAVLTPVTAGFAKDGIVDCLVYNAPEKVSALLDAPTRAEYPDKDIADILFEPAVWGPPGISESVTTTLSEANQAVCNSDEYKQVTSEAGMQIGGKTAKETKELVQRYVDLAPKYQEIVQQGQ